MQQLRQEEQQNDILLLLDNVDKFAGGDDVVFTSLNSNFVTFLQGLLGPKILKILLTSRSTLRRAKLANIDNYEVMALERKLHQVFFSKIRELAAFERMKWRNCCRCEKGIPSSLREWQLS